jgi:hypothetical protein
MGRSLLSQIVLLLAVASLLGSNGVLGGIGAAGNIAGTVSGPNAAWKLDEDTGLTATPNRHRKLLQNGAGGGGAGGASAEALPYTLSNSLRSELATVDAVQRATNSGAKLRTTDNAAGVGAQTVFANTQGGQGLFDQVENTLRTGGK